jgi:hypothetical protein
VTPDHAPVAGAAPHWATTVVTEKVARERATHEAQLAQADVRARIATLVKTSGASWMLRLSHELRRVAAAVDASVGHPVLDVRINATTFAVVTLTQDGAFVLFVPRPVELEAADLADLVVRVNSPAERLRTEVAYAFSLGAEGELVIEGRSPEAFARFVCERWVQTLPLELRA